MAKQKAMVVTTSRADYGLLYPLLKMIRDDDDFELLLVATGSHLSELHGHTIHNIEADGFEVSERLSIISGEDTEYYICKSISDGMTGFSKILSKHLPDFVVVLGDRYELLSICIASLVHKVPIVHIHGGEVTLGAIDNSIRHSITKMASIHYASLDEYAKRIIQMGEEPERVFSVGALGIDNILSVETMSVKELSEFTGVDFNKQIALLTYHPITLDDYSSAAHQIEEVLEAILETGLVTIITMPNADSGSSLIYESIKKYVADYPDRFKLIKNLGQRVYLSSMKHAKLMIGNSSSGIIESASFGIPVVNIGDRQTGRVKPGNIIDCICSKNEIKKAINISLSADFSKRLNGIENPYGKGDTANKIMKSLKTVNFKDKTNLLKKNFFDIEFIERVCN